jgi:purine-binding chemotaxis protein CheW
MTEGARGRGDAGEERLPSGETLPEDAWMEDEEEEAEAQETRIELLSFTAGDEEFALSVFEVKEIINYQPVTVIPRCPEYIIGVISLRGEIIPVLDLKKRLGIGGAAPGGEPMIVIVAQGDEAAGLLVDGITGMIIIRESEVEVTPDVVSPEKAEFFRGVVRSGERLATILNVDRILDVSGDLNRRN